MTSTPISRNQSWVFTLCLLLPMGSSSAQFVDLTAELETVEWDASIEAPPQVRARTWKARCVVGTNTWLIETGFYAEGNSISWFDGSNIVNSFVRTKPISDRKELYERNHGPMPPVGQGWTYTRESVDGNPGRAARVSDLMDYPAKLCWLAFCSGPVLRREGRQVFPPGDFWKEHIMAPSGFSDQTTVFEDALGLPASMTLYTASKQPVLQYRVTLSTNIVEWNFPLEFHLVQYVPAGTNGWALSHSAKGKVMSIGIGEAPHPPPDSSTKTGR